MKFQSKYNYHDRESKAFYVWNKYYDLLRGKILDVGVDQCYLKEHLSGNAKYGGISLHSDKIALEIDLGKQPLLYEDNSFDVVLCCE